MGNLIPNMHKGRCEIMLTAVVWIIRTASDGFCQELHSALRRLHQIEPRFYFAQRYVQLANVLEQLPTRTAYSQCHTQQNSTNWKSGWVGWKKCLIKSKSSDHHWEATKHSSPEQNTQLRSTMLLGSLGFKDQVFALAAKRLGGCIAEWNALNPHLNQVSPSRAWRQMTKMVAGVKRWRRDHQNALHLLHISSSTPRISKDCGKGTHAKPWRLHGNWKSLQRIWDSHWV